MSWTELQVQTVKERWAVGYSAQQIADELGVTRNTVCGKLNRLKLPARNIPGAGKPGRAASNNGRRPHRRKAVGAAPAAPRVRLTDGALTPHLPPEPAPPPLEALHIELGALERHHCRWPFGDGPFTFCGHQNGDGPYCAYHARIARRG